MVLGVLFSVIILGKEDEFKRVGFLGSFIGLLVLNEII